MQINRENFKNQEKKLKRYYYEQERLEKILTHIRQCNSVEDLQNNPISKMYGLEALKHEYSGLYSFRLSKGGGKIRLIVSLNIEYNVLILEEISMDHYKDIKRK